MTKVTEVCVMQTSGPESHPNSSEWRLCNNPAESSRLYVSTRCAANLGVKGFGYETTYGTLHADNWALCIIKPDARKHQGLENEIRRYVSDRIARSGIVLSQHDVGLSLPMLNQIWPAPTNERGDPLPPSPWWDATVEYMTSAPVNVWLVHGIGASASLLALKSALRQSLYGEGYQQNELLPMSQRVRSVIHTSDCDRELVGNMLAFWDHGTIRDAVMRERCISR